MDPKRFQINVRDTQQGTPKFSFTFHKPGRRCGKRGAHLCDEYLWKEVRSLKEVDEYARYHLLGACKRCWGKEKESMDRHFRSRLGT